MTTRLRRAHSTADSVILRSVFHLIFAIFNSFFVLTSLSSGKRQVLLKNKNEKKLIMFLFCLSFDIY